MTTMLRATRSMLLSAATLLAIAGLAACGREADTAKPNLEVNKENAAMRTEVPLTRPITLDKAGEVANVEFELPPPGPNASPDLMLGIRLVRPDAGSGTALSMSLVEAEIAAKVNLIRIEDGAIKTVPLTRDAPNLRGSFQVSPDGTVPGLTMSGVDPSLLQSAGLVDAAVYYDVLQFAYAENIQPGRYRLTVELTGDHPEFRGESAELLVAYFKKAK